MKKKKKNFPVKLIFLIYLFNVYTTAIEITPSGSAKRTARGPCLNVASSFYVRQLS